MSPAVPRWQFGEPVAPVRRVVAAGGVLAIPTESSYGLAVDPGNRQAVEAIYRLKERDAGKPLLVVAADLEQLLALGIDPDLPILSRLAALWPAPLTAVLPRHTGADLLAAAAGGDTLAVRIPAHGRLRRLLNELGVALTATSANRSGEPAILDPDEVVRFLTTAAERLGVPTLVVDDGVLRGGPPSTLVAWDDPRAGRGFRVLRAGALEATALGPLRRAG